MRLPGKLWFRSKVSGVEWQHRLVSQTVLDKLNDGETCYAVSKESHRACYYLNSEPDDSLRLLVLHELFHLISMSPGESHTLYEIYGVTDKTDSDVYHNREETAATLYSRVYAEAIGGFLKLPKPPRKSSAQ